ncbi:TPA: hypothetical protein ACO4GR_004175 [Escherichia coli]
MGSCAAPSAKGDDKFITTDYLQQCLPEYVIMECDKLIALPPAANQSSVARIA